MNKEQQNMRQNPRSPLNRDLSNYLLTRKERKPIRCMGVDISRDSINIVSFEDLEVDSEVVLMIKDRGINLKVALNRADPSRKSIFHLELKVTNPLYNLVKIFEEGGLSPAPSKASSQPQEKDQKDQQKEAQSKEIDFSMLKELMANLNTTDNRLHQSEPFAKLSVNYKIFPVSMNNQSIVILVSRDLKPREIMLLEESEAIGKVFVLQKTGSNLGSLNWRRIWPKE